MEEVLIEQVEQAAQDDTSAIFGLIIVLIIIGIIIYRRRRSKRNKADSDNTEDVVVHLTRGNDLGDSLELPICGINFRNLTEANTGFFEGYIKPDRKNKHDKYAIGVYGADGTQFGYLERGLKTLFERMGDNRIAVELYIHTFIDEESGRERFAGTVTIQKNNLQFE